MSFVILRRSSECTACGATVGPFRTKVIFRMAKIAHDLRRHRKTDLSAFKIGPSRKQTHALARADHSMCVEQQHHNAEGWSMARSWAWDNLREAVEPFLVRDETGDVVKFQP